MLENTNNPNLIILISCLIVISLFFPIQYVHENTVAGTCPMFDVNSVVNFEQWGYNARCSGGPPHEDFFELAGGILLGSIAFAVAFLCLPRIHKISKVGKICQIGALTGLAFGVEQIFEAIVQNRFGWMYNRFDEMLPVLHIFLMIAVIYFGGKLILSRKFVKLDFNPKIHKEIIIGGIALSLILTSFHIMNPAHPTFLVAIIGLSAAAAHRWIRVPEHKKTNLTD